MIELLREYRKEGTFGVMTLEDGAVFATVERPWLDNKPGISCIPEGVYRLALRVSPIIQRTTHDKYQRGWEVTDVPKRSMIMIHIANFVHELQGCIGVGLRHGFIGVLYGVQSSAVAFDRLMSRLATRDEWYIEIKGAEKNV